MKLTKQRLIEIIKEEYQSILNEKTVRLKNMDINFSQYERNLEAIQFGQEAQSTYLTPPNSNLLFASAALNVANSYYNLQRTKEAEDIK